LVNINGDGSVWGLNSMQFIKEKMLRSPASTVYTLLLMIFRHTSWR